MMIHCYLTGVECRQEDSFVLNRREARDLLEALKDRVASLRRVVEQLSPLDDKDIDTGVPPSRRAGFAPRKHRLVCKAVADAMTPGFPEVALFLGWPQYQAMARKTIHQHARGATKAQPTSTVLPAHEN